MVSVLTNQNCEDWSWSRGQLWSQVMKGYFNNDKATQETLFDGWIHTGDIGYYDEVSAAQWTIKLSDRS